MKTFLRILSVICLIAWMGLIFFLSSQDAEQSSEVSGGLIATVVEKVYPEFESLTNYEQEEIISSFQHVVRKSAHFCIFAGLGFFAFLTFISYVNLKIKTRIFYMLFVSALYAASDEIHQNFVAGRSMELRDFLIDFCGALLAVLICSLFVAAIRPLREKVRFKAKTASKKALVNLTNQLYEKLDDSLYLQKQMEKEIIGYKAMIEKLNAQKEEPQEQTPVIEESKPIEPQIPEDFEFAASVIGKTVVEATRTCNELTIQNGAADKKELVNLVLGRTEVLKAEILKILNSTESFEQKKDLMQKEQMAAYDYFNSIKAQIS